MLFICQLNQDVVNCNLHCHIFAWRTNSIIISGVKTGRENSLQDPTTDQEQENKSSHIAARAKKSCSGFIRKNLLAVRLLRQ